MYKKLILLGDNKFHILLLKCVSSSLSFEQNIFSQFQQYLIERFCLITLVCDIWNCSSIPKKRLSLYI